MNLQEILKTLTDAQREAIERLIASGALDTQGGSVELHFDKDGRLRGIRREFWSYKA